MRKNLQTKERLLRIFLKNPKESIISWIVILSVEDVVNMIFYHELFFAWQKNDFLKEKVFFIVRSTNFFISKNEIFIFQVIFTT